MFFFSRGSGEDGQLGLGTYEEKEWACVVEALDPFAVRSVVGGSRNSLAICDGGKVNKLFSFSLVGFAHYSLLCIKVQCF